MSNTMLRAAVSIVCMLAATGVGAGQVVVSNTYENFDTEKDLVNVPVTFSRIGADGDFTAGITPMIDGVRLRSQVNVLRRAKDGSIRHALVTFVLPKLAAGGKVKIDWLNEKPPGLPMVKRRRDPFGITLKLVLSRAVGGDITSDLGKVVLDDLALRKGIKRIHSGPLMKEWEIHDVPVDAEGNKDPHIDVYWRLRVFAGERSVRVACVVERSKDRKKSGPEPVQHKFKSVKLLADEKALYEEGPYDHLDQTRYRILVWTGGALENIHRRPNYDYWVKGKFVPKYRWAAKGRTPAEVDNTYPVPSPGRELPKRDQGILESGVVYRHMPGTGGRWDVGPYPFWSVSYLLSGAPKTYRAILHADGNGGGAFYIHVRQDGMPGYNVYTVTQRPLDKGYFMPLYTLPDGSKPPCQPDHAHAPSIGYIAYLLTGDKYYAEEMSFWASYQMGVYPWKGLKWQQFTRDFAWGLRHVVDAAFILPEEHPLREYFVKGVNKCMDEMTAGCVNSDRRVHSPPAGVFQCSGRPFWVNSERCSTWMYSWVVWSLGNAVDKGFPKAAKVRDWAAEYIVSLYTSEDEFKAPDGKTYKVDPRDAIPYSTAISLVESQIVPGPAGKMGIKGGKRIRYLDNYGEVWYYTKLNVDNSWYPHPHKGLRTRPSADGVWPLREDGFGGGKMYWVYDDKVKHHWNMHVYSMVALTMAVEADVSKARKAWEVMMSLGGKSGEYGIQMVPRVPGRW